MTPYSWSVVSGSLPSGLSLGSSTGTISGTPTASGTSNFTVRVTDSQTQTPATNDKALSITIDPASSEPTYKQTSSDTESTTTSTSFVEKLSKSWTSGSTGNWLLLGSARTSLSSGNCSTETRWQYNDSTTVATQELAVHQYANEVMCNNGIGVINVTDGSRKVDLDYRLVYSVATTKIKYAHITVLPLD